MTCTVSDCDGAVRSRGLCNRHYQAEWRAAHVEQARASKRASVAKKPEYYRAQRAEYYALNREQVLARQAQYRAENREAITAREAAARLADPEARRAATRRWAASNPERARANSRRWAAANPDRRRLREAQRRARIRGNGAFLVTPRDIARLVARHNWRCAYCSTVLVDGFHVDHVVPIVRGGRHAIGNLLPACPSCNCSKHASLLSEWRSNRKETPWP